MNNYSIYYCGDSDYTQVVSAYIYIYIYIYILTDKTVGQSNHLFSSY